MRRFAVSAFAGITALSVIALFVASATASGAAGRGPRDWATRQPVSAPREPSAADEARMLAELARQRRARAEGLALAHAREQAGAEAERARLHRARQARASRSSPRGGDVWTALARCESNGNPRAVSRGGRYRGAFQFSMSTWRSLGYGGDPVDHSYEVQLEAARRLQARSGWGQWPACARRLGLR